MESSGMFQWPDYLVFTLGMLASACIGVYYAIQRYRNSQAGVSEYLMGSRNMGIIPVATSLVVSLLSAVTLMGLPSEVYSFGMSISLVVLSFTLSFIITGMFYLPVFHKLKLTSVNEYLEMRFSSHIRMLSSAITVLSMLMVSAIIVYVPSLAISQVTGMPYWACVFIPAALSTFYTILVTELLLHSLSGGFKSVLWTDTLQASIMIVSMLVIFSKGTIDAGGITHIMNISRVSGRLDMRDITPNLLSRYSVWGWLFGDLSRGISLYGIGQPYVQRLCSVPSINKARLSVLLAVPIMSTFLLLATFSGLVAFTFYFGCDPLSSGKINRKDQIIPALVMDIFQLYPGIPGIFLSSVFSGSLSTISSQQHSIAALLLQDFFKPAKLKVTGKPFSNRQGTILSQIIVLLVGTVITIIATGVANMKGMVLQLGSTYSSMGSGPLLGVFSAGIFFSFTNSWGAISGLITSLAMMLWINIGSNIYPGTATKPLPTYNHLCSVRNASVTFNNSLANHSILSYTTKETIVTAIPETSGGLQIYDIPYRYHTTVAASIALGACLLVSLATGGWRTRHKVPKELLYSWKQHGINTHCSTNGDNFSSPNVEEQDRANRLLKQETLRRPNEPRKTRDMQTDGHL